MRVASLLGVARGRFGSVHFTIQNPQGARVGTDNFPRIMWGRWRLCTFPKEGVLGRHTLQVSSLGKSQGSADPPGVQVPGEGSVGKG